MIILYCKMLTENANAAMQPKDTSAINKNRKKRGRNPTALMHVRREALVCC